MQIPTDNKLDFSIWLYKTLSNKSIDQSRYVLGELPIGFEYEEIFKALERNTMDCSECDEDNRIIHFELPYKNSGFFALTMEQLLENPDKSTNPPIRFYLADSDFTYPDDSDKGNNSPEEITGYLQRVKLISHIRDKVVDYHHRQSGTETLVFIMDKKLEIDVHLNAGSLKPIPGAESIIEDFISSETHSDQKITILKSSIIDEFSNGLTRYTKISINDFFEKAQSILEDSIDAYDLFISEFSFKKIKDEVEREKLDFTIKLNSVFSSIQNQLLAIPVALVIVGGQMDKADQWTQKNLVIWLGALVFAFLLSLLVRNQKSTITAIRQEIDLQWKKIQEDHRLISDRFSALYHSLERRYLDQVVLIWIVDFLVAASVTTASIFLLWASVPWPLAEQAMVYAAIGGIAHLFLAATWHRRQCLDTLTRMIRHFRR